MESIEIRTAVPDDKDVVEAVIRSCDPGVDGIFAPAHFALWSASTPKLSELSDWKGMADRRACFEAWQFCRNIGDGA